MRVSSLRAPWETSLELALGIQGTEFGGGGGSLSGSAGGHVGALDAVAKWCFCTDAEWDICMVATTSCLEHLVMQIRF